MSYNLDGKKKRGAKLSMRTPERYSVNYREPNSFLYQQWDRVLSELNDMPAEDDFTEKIIGSKTDYVLGIDNDSMGWSFAIDVEELLSINGAIETDAQKNAINELGCGVDWDDDKECCYVEFNNPKAFMDWLLFRLQGHKPLAESEKEWYGYYNNASDTKNQYLIINNHIELSAYCGTKPDSLIIIDVVYNPTRINHTVSNNDFQSESQMSEATFINYLINESKISPIEYKKTAYECYTKMAKLIWSLLENEVDRIFGD